MEIFRQAAKEQQKRVLPPPQVNPNAAPIRLNHDELQWDEGTITRYVSNPTTHYYEYTLPTAKAKIHLWAHQPSISLQQVAETAERILLWFGVPLGFTVYLWLQDDPRQISASEWPSRRTVNGGWTIPNSKTVYVYRAEEWERVLIHELIHALGWDWVMPSTPLPCWNVEGTFAPHLFESWTELYAEWLYCAWFNIPWEFQRKHQHAQAVQVLSRAPSKWSENTNVFAYYVLKAALAEHILLLLTVNATPQERLFLLCDLVKEPLRRLREEAKRTVPRPMSLRMTVLHLSPY